MSAIISTNVDGTGHTPTVAIPQEFLNAAGATAIGVGIGTSFSIEKAGGWLAVAESTTGAAAYGAAAPRSTRRGKWGTRSARSCTPSRRCAMSPSRSSVPSSRLRLQHRAPLSTCSTTCTATSFHPPDIDGIWEIGFVASMVALNPFTNISP